MSTFYNIVEYKQAIYFFLEIYNLPVDLFDMLKKHDYRKRKKIIPKKTQKLASQFNPVLSRVSPLMSFFVLLCPFFL